MNSLSKQRLHVGSGTTVDAVTVFPIWVQGSGAADLDWEGGRLRVTEHPDGARVDRLVATNAGERPVVVLEGDLMEGGLQHRLVASGWVLGPREATTLPVRCVEQHRWAGGSEHRAANRRAGYRVLNARRDADG